MDSGPCDRHFALGSDGSDAATRPANVSFRGDIVPHGMKKRKTRVYDLGRGNAFALSPQTPNQGPLTRGPFTCQSTCHVVPLTGVRVTSCHVSAPPAPHVGHARPCHVALCAASHQRGSLVPRQLHAKSAPRHVSYGVCGSKYTFFAILIKKNQLKNKIKIRKRHKLQTIHNFKYTTPF